MFTSYFVEHSTGSMIETPLITYVTAYVTGKIVSEYDQEIPKSQTADKPTAPGVRATQQSQDIRKTN